MAIVRTNSVHYEGIADAIRELHNGTETYTPEEMAAYLATQGIELKSENIAEGITIFGVEGNMKMSQGWPGDVPTEEEFDDVVGDLDPEAPAMDKMLLMDDKGNVTVGYMYNTPVTEKYSYGGAALAEIPELKYPNACIVVGYSATGAIRYADLYCADGELLYYPTDGTLATRGKNWADCFYSVTTGKWGNYSLRSTSNTLLDINTIGRVNDSQELVWGNKNIKRSDGSVYLAGSTAEAANFTITAYDYRTTDFRAIGWIRVAYHTTGEHAGQFTVDDFRTTESGGWNYIKNVRWSSRAKLSYMDADIWPQGPQMYDYNGHLLPVDPQSLTFDNYTYAYITYVSSRYYAYATKAPLKQRENGSPSLSTDNTILFNAASLLIAQQSGRRAKREYRIDSAHVIVGKPLWSNYNMEYLAGGIAIEASAPVPVRMTDLRPPPEPDSPVVTGQFCIYGKPSENGKIAVADGDGYVLYEGDVLPQLPAWDESTYPIATINWNYKKDPALRNVICVTCTAERYWSENLMLSPYVHSKAPCLWARLNQDKILAGEPDEWNEYRVSTSDRYDGSSAVMWTNTDLYKNGELHTAATAPIPLASPVPIRYEGNIPIYQKKE